MTEYVGLRIKFFFIMLLGLLVSYTGIIFLHVRDVISIRNIIQNPLAVQDGLVLMVVAVTLLGVLFLLLSYSQSLRMISKRKEYF
jgi:hypothetical protein